MWAREDGEAFVPADPAGCPEPASRRQLVIWIAAALAGCLLLAGALVWAHRRATTRWSSFLVGDPNIGARLFFDRKGCAQCHAVNGFGASLAPDLGYSRTAEANLGQLVTSMWNHAPAMWERIEAQKAEYPELSRADMAHLFAFLYTNKYLDEPGDAYRGQQLFAKDSCDRCHAVRGSGARIGPDLALADGIDTPIRWAQAMWNHAPAMQERMAALGIEWARFGDRDMNDLLAYVRDVNRGMRRERQLLPASPSRGWEIFRSKSCILCHAVNHQGGHEGPELGPGRKVPLTIVQFAGLMWNHSPEMWKALRDRNTPRPTFNGQQIADLVAFLCSIRYFEPGGSPEVGQTLFGDRGCARCHGPTAEGTRLGPALRGRGDPATSLMLATALWDHGPKMYKRAKQLKLPWPKLKDTDVGDILAFLNYSGGLRP